MKVSAGYVYSTVTIECGITRAVNWITLTIKHNNTTSGLGLILLPSNISSWSTSDSDSNDVVHDVTKNSDGTDHVILKVTIKGVQCEMARTVFKCVLRTGRDGVIVAKKRIQILGPPENTMNITLGPSIVENRALRITARWHAGYPTPWTNISWSASSRDGGKVYDLTRFGEYKDYRLHIDDERCQTTLEHSLVIFPNISLNDSAVMVKPDLQRTSPFVTPDMMSLLHDVTPGTDRLLIIPMTYCTNHTGDNLAHPYKPCRKFVRCIPDDVVVQQCPTGTCFWSTAGRCVPS